MSEDIGRSGGLSPTVEPVPVSPLYVVFRATGEYSDRNEEPIGFTRDEDIAKGAVVKADEQWRGAVATHPLPGWPDDDADEAAYEQFDAAKAARLDAVRSCLTIDPNAASDYDDEPRYFYREVPTLAQAFSAGTAETPKDGSGLQPASAVRKDAPNASPTSSMDSNEGEGS